MLEPVELEEGEEVQIIIRPSESTADKFYGIARKRRPDIRREEFLEILEKIKDEGFSWTLASYWLSSPAKTREPGS